MKRISTLVLLCFFFSVSLTFAQQSKTIDFTNSQNRSYTLPDHADISFRMEMDTLFPPSFSEECGGTLSDFSITERWGRVSGMNEFMDLQKAQRFTYEGASTYTVNQVGVWFSLGEIVGDGEIKVNIYDVSGDGAPGSLLGSSDPLKVSELYIPGDEDPLAPTAFSFSTPALVQSEQFFVSVDFTALYSSQDTVALYNTQQDCGDGTSTYELFGDGVTWEHYVETWNLNADLAILAIVEEQEDVVLMPIDTAFTPSFKDTCGQTVQFFGVQDGWGYVAGTNNFGDLEKAQRFDFQGADNYNLTEAFVFFHAAEVVGDGDVQVKIYDVAGNGSPGELLGTSLPLKVSQLATPDQSIPATQFLFENPVPLKSSRFFVSVDLSAVYTAQDTVGIWHTRPDCGNGNSTWELFSDGTSWVPFTDPSSWQFNTDLFIFAVLEQISTDVEDLSPEAAGIYLQDAYPNPASDQITLDFSLDQKEEISVTIYQANGQLVKNHYIGARAQGEHREVLSLQNLNNGVYFYSFSTSKTRVLKKFIIQK